MRMVANRMPMFATCGKLWSTSKDGKTNQLSLMELVDGKARALTEKALWRPLWETFDWGVQLHTMNAMRKPSQET